MPAFAEPMSLSNLLQRERLSNGKRKSPSLDQLADLTQCIPSARGVRTASNGHTEVLRSLKIGDCHDTLRAARQLDKCRQRSATGIVDRTVHAVGHQLTDTPHQPIAICGRLGAEGPQ